MCYDISFTTSLDEISNYLQGIVADQQLQFDFDSGVHVLAHSFRKYPVIINEDGLYKLKTFEWGVIADYMNTPEKIKKQRATMCNARSEKILEDKRSYWHRIRRQRCLIPVTGIFEHREIKGWKNKVPYFIRLKDRELFCIPGLYHYSPVPDVETGEMRGTYTLITRGANSVMAQIHNCGDNAFRMPLFLTKELEMRWLDPNLTDQQMGEILNYEMPSEALDYHPVFTIRSPKPRPDQKSKIEEFEWPNLPELGNDQGGGTQAAIF
ncbi:MAG TPA: SOS response-associated peptidase family protein [Chitinophagaceae bacterium]